MRKTTLLFPLVMIFAASSAARAQAQAPAQEWVWPNYQADPAVAKQLTTIDHFDYREMRYEPAVVIEALPAGVTAFDTPERAFITRVSHMMRLDYDGWLATWDTPALRRVRDRDRRTGRVRNDWLDWWRSTFQTARVSLVRRIETGPYVILTYRVTAPEKTDLSQVLEIPVVLARRDGVWKVSLDLSADPLPIYSPWVTGATRSEETVR